MKVIILAGGLPSTLIEEDEKMPKPMAEIGGRPMLWHIMDTMILSFAPDTKEK